MPTKQQRKTAQRKARQAAAFDVLCRGQGMHVRGYRGLVPVTDPSMLPERTKHLLIKSFKRLTNA